MKCLGSLPRNWYFNVFSVEVKSEVLALRVNFFTVSISHVFHIVKSVRCLGRLNYRFS